MENNKIVNCVNNLNSIIFNFNKLTEFDFLKVDNLKNNLNEVCSLLSDYSNKFKYVQINEKDEVENNEFNNQLLKEIVSVQNNLVKKINENIDEFNDTIIEYLNENNIENEKLSEIINDISVNYDSFLNELKSFLIKDS